MGWVRRDYTRRIVAFCLHVSLAIYVHGVSRAQRAAFDHAAEYAFAGHYAVAHLVIYRAVRMALLPYLGKFEQHVARPEPGSYGKLF